MKLHCLQHVSYEGPAMIADWAKERGHGLALTRFHEERHVLPEVAGIDALIVMGGSMGVGDEGEYPWLKGEKDLIRAAIDAGKHVLGVCLGAQLVAQVLGARVAPQAHKEIGWFPIAFTDEALGHPLLEGLNPAMTVFHWHGDRFAIPTGAMRVAASQACDNQGFVFGSRILGLQFHLEMDAPAVSSIVEACAHQLVPGPYVQPREEILAQARRRPAAARSALYRLLDNWLRQD